MNSILSLSRLALFLAVFITTIFILGATSFAQITVTNLDNAGAGSLRQAIIDANNNPGPDVIVFQAGLTGVIPTDAAVDNTFTGEMVITDDVTITGPGANVITIDAQMEDRIFNIDDGLAPDIVVSISGLMLINGLADSGGAGDNGGAILNNEELSIDSCVFENNSAVDAGGAIFNGLGATIVEIANTTFSGNMVTDLNGDGGAIFNDNDAIIEKVNNSTFSGNSADDSGGAIYNDVDGTIEEINNTTFSGNSAGDDGGAIFNAGGNTIGAITSTTFSGNSANFGGAIFNTGVGIIEQINHSIFSGNSATSDGSAIFNNDDATIEQIAYGTFSDNIAGDDGGAIANDGTIEVIHTCTFNGNVAGSGDGGAIFNNINSIIEQINTSTFSGNSAGNDGGAIANTDNSTIEDMTNCTISGNTAENSGGAIFNNNDMNISFTTIANNEAVTGGGGGILQSLMATTNFRNSIVAFNMAGAAGPNCDGMTTDLGNNYADNAGCTFGPGDNSIILLGDLADNGGPTETRALLGGDPLDGASTDCDPLDSMGMPTTVPLPNDQRFFPRPFGPFCDSGAFENGPSASVSITKITDPPGGTGFMFTTTGFEDLEGCDLQGEAIVGELDLSHGETASCVVPFGDYSITETIPAGQVLNIFCSQPLPPGTVIDNDTGELSFSIISSQFNVDCLFINVFPDTLINVTEEPPGENCAQGGVKIETGVDTNLNGVLDPDEVINTFFVCNGEPGVQGPQGPQGPGGPPGPPGTPSLILVSNEPPGQNCPEGGIKIETGLDTNANGLLDLDEILETFFVCNGEPGVQGPQGPQGPGGGDGNSSCSSLAGANTTNGSLMGLIIYALIPAAVLLRRRLRKS